MTALPIKNRVTEMTGTDYPIIQAPMGWIARAQLAAAVSNAGGMGIIETSSGELDAVREEIIKMRDLTDKPFGVNILYFPLDHLPSNDPNSTVKSLVHQKGLRGRQYDLKGS